MESEVGMIGIKIDEIMIGTHRFANGDVTERPLIFSLTWGNNNLLNFLNPFSPEFLVSEAKGMITVGGLVNKADCSGSLKLLYFNGRKIRYELEFKDDNGRKYRYVGEKVNIWPWNLHKTHVTCYGTIREIATGMEISRSVIYFPLREMVPFVLSARLTRA
jgi:hypothetical protein